MEKISFNISDNGECTWFDSWEGKYCYEYGDYWKDKMGRLKQVILLSKTNGWDFKEW